MLLLWCEGLNKHLWALSVKKCFIDSKWSVPVVRRVLVQLGGNISIFSFVPTVNFLFASLKRLLLVVFLQFWSPVGSALLFCFVLFCSGPLMFAVKRFQTPQFYLWDHAEIKSVCVESSLFSEFPELQLFYSLRQRIMKSGWLMSLFDRFHPPQLIFIHL